MADTGQRQATVGTGGTVTVRHRPVLALMKVTLRAADATPESGLTNLKKQCEATGQWLKRLGARRVDFGEPHFADQGDKNPLMPRVMVPRPPGKGMDKEAERKREVRAIVSGQWDITAMSADETLLLVDRLRFESADAATAKEAEEPATWASPQEQILDMMAKMQEPADDTAPVILFIARLGEEQLESAFGEAMGFARTTAARLARAAGMRLGELRSLHTTIGAMNTSRTDKIMDRQRCGALLAGCSYALSEDEIVSDDPRSAEFTVTVHATFALE